MKRFIAIFILLSVLFSKVSFAQTFIPGAQDQSSTGKTYSGNSFSGTGAALSSCLGIGQWASKGINKLTDKLKEKKYSGATKGLDSGTSGIKVDGNVPTFDKTVTSEEKSQNAKENCLDAAAYAASQSAIQNVTNQTLNWVNTGFGGNPLYVLNTQSFLNSIENDQIKNFISQSTNTLLVGNTTGQAVNNSILSMIAGRKLPQNTNTQTEPFMSDFSQGGWTSFFKLIDPVNNPVSQVLTQSQNLQNTILQQKTDVTNLLMQGQGMLPQQKCVEEGTEKNPDGTKRCLKYETVTPGSIIAEQVKNVTNSPLRQREQADELNEIVGGYFDTLINNLFNQGLGSLGRSRNNFGLDLSAFGGFGSNAIIGSNGQVLNNTKKGGGFTGSDFNISNPGHIRAVLQTQYDYLTNMTDAESSVQKIIPVVGRLDYCFPGPNPVWQDGLGLSYGSYQGAIMGASVNYQGNYTKLSPYTLSDNIFNFEKTMRDQTFELNRPPVSAVLTTPISVLGNLIGGQVPKLFDTTEVLPRLSVIFDTWITSYQEAMAEKFNTDSVVESFVATTNTPVDKAIMRVEAKQMAKESSQLSAYISSTAEIVDEYGDARDETLINIKKLEAIDKEILTIITEARTRYIKEKKNQGVTIKTSCLDRNYNINPKPIEIKPQKEADPAPELQKLEEYKKAFYANI